MSNTVKGISTAKGFHAKVPFAEHAEKASCDNEGNDIPKTYRKIGSSLVKFDFAYRETMIFNKGAVETVTLDTGEVNPFIAGVAMEVQIKDSSGNWCNGYIRLDAVDCTYNSNHEGNFTSLAGILTVLGERRLNKFYHVNGVYQGKALQYAGGDNSFLIGYVYDENGTAEIDIYVSSAVVRLS